MFTRPEPESLPPAFGCANCASLQSPTAYLSTNTLSRNHVLRTRLQVFPLPHAHTTRDECGPATPPFLSQTKILNHFSTPSYHLWVDKTTFNTSLTALQAFVPDNASSSNHAYKLWRGTASCAWPCTLPPIRCKLMWLPTSQ